MRWWERKKKTSIIQFDWKDSVVSMTQWPQYRDVGRAVVPTLSWCPEAFLEPVADSQFSCSICPLEGNCKVSLVRNSSWGGGGSRGRWLYYLGLFHHLFHILYSPDQKLYFIRQEVLLCCWGHQSKEEKLLFSFCSFKSDVLPNYQYQE